MGEVREGTVLRYRRTGVEVTIERRKEDDSGWWNTDGSGFSDHALTLDAWEVVAEGKPQP